MKLIAKVLSLFDYAALAVGIIGLSILFGVVFIRGILVSLMDTAKAIDQMWADASDRVVILIFLACVGWCVLRWKKLNSRE